METATFTVQGMTCEHCVASVTDEIGAIDGVTGVEVDRASGAVTVTSENPLSPDEVHVAVRAAGYEPART